MVHTDESAQSSPANRQTARDADSWLALTTYRNLRIGMIGLITMLAVAVAWQWAEADHCFETSISAYYYTGAHSVFVAALCAMGALLVIYKGSSDTEDVLLNFSGFFAFLVAFVPTDWPAAIKDANDRDIPVVKCAAGVELPSDYAVLEPIPANVWAVFIAGIVVAVVGVIRIYFGKEKRPAAVGEHHILGVVARVLGGFVTVAIVVFFAFWPETYEDIGHGLAAIPMFVAIIFVVFANAYLASVAPGRAGAGRFYKWSYIVLGVLMLIALAIVIYLHCVLLWTHWVIGIETVLIGLFAVFWGVQTRELWNTGLRRLESSPTLPKGADMLGMHVDRTVNGHSS